MGDKTPIKVTPMDFPTAMEEVHKMGIEKGRQMERERIIVLLIEKGYLLGEQVLETRKPTHGNCCTCQTCGQGHDECVCDHNELLQALEGGKDV